MGIFGYDKKHVRILLRVLFVAALCLGVGTATHYYSSARPKDIYEKAQKKIEEGDYYEAEQLLKDIEDYGDAGELRRQIADENIVFKCLKNGSVQEDVANLLQVYQVEMYKEKNGEYAVVITFGLLGEDGETMVRKVLFTYDDGYKIYHSSISSSESGNLKTEEDKQTYAEIERYRTEYENSSHASIDRINRVLKRNLEIQIY